MGMTRRFLAVFGLVLALTIGATGVAQAQEQEDGSYITSTTLGVWFRAWDYPFPVYFQGYCLEPGFTPTADITEIYNLPEDWSVEVAWVSPETQSVGFQVNRAEMYYDGLQQMEVFFRCVPKETNE
jgi:hypothetical protein